MPEIGTWDKLKMAPTTLVKLCVEGKAEVIGKDAFGRKIWKVD